MAENRPKNRSNQGNKGFTLFVMLILMACTVVNTYQCAKLSKAIDEMLGKEKETVYEKGYNKGYDEGYDEGRGVGRMEGYVYWRHRNGE